MKRCTKCVMPETWPGIVFDGKGVCNLCLEHEKKLSINWKERQAILETILSKYRLHAALNGNKYNCLVGYSGGKDTAYTLWAMVKKYYMRPLAFTFDHGFLMTPEGRYNLEEIPKILDVDHVRFTLGNGLRNALCKKGCEEIGDFCYFCHAGVGAMPANISKMYDIPLQIWGEPTAEYQTTGIRYSMLEPEEQNKGHYLKAFVGDKTPEQMVPDGYSVLDVKPLMWSADTFPLKAIYLGNYEPWNQRYNAMIIQSELGWKPRKSLTTYVNFDKVDCTLEDTREYQKYMRRGFGKVSFQASKDIWDEIMTREQALKLIYKYEGRVPKTLDAQLNEMSMTKDEFDRLTNKQII